jgi:hypothetical protein
LFLEVAAKVDGYPDYASFCDDLEQPDKGRCYRDLAGLDEAIPDRIASVTSENAWAMRS